jgi:hypothetical protein
LHFLCSERQLAIVACRGRCALWLVAADSHLAFRA